MCTLNASSAVSSSIASVGEYWSSQKAEIRLSLDFKYGAAEQLPSTVIREVHDNLNLKHNKAQQRTNEWLYAYLHHN
jgi:glycyl-tRNA synthetase alpha subunit